MSERERERASEYKTGLGRNKTHTDKRKKQTIEIRKKNRMKKLQAKRRRMASNRTTTTTYDAKELGTIVQQLKENQQKRTENLKRVRKILSIPDDPPIDAVIELGLIPVLLQCLSSHVTTEEQKLEACWCFTNIASGTHKQTEYALQAAPYLIQFLGSSSSVFQEQAAWCLGNIAADDEWRARLHSNGVVKPTLKLLDSKNTEVLRTATWASTNLARGYRTSARPFVNQAGERMITLLNHDDPVIVSEVAWMLSFLTAREDDAVTYLLSKGFSNTLVNSFVKRIKHVFSDKTNEIEVSSLTPFVRCLGNVLSGPDVWSESVLSRNEVWDIFYRIIQISASQCMPGNCVTVRIHRTLTKEVSWVLSNIAGGTPEQCQRLVKMNFVPALCVLLKECDFDVKREVAHVLFNIMSQNHARHLPLILSQQGTLEVLIRLLCAPDPAMIHLGIGFVSSVLEHRVKDGRQLVQELNGIELLENLQYRDNIPPELCRMAKDIIDKYFGEDDEEEEMDASMDFSNFTGFTSQQPSGGRGRGLSMTKPAWQT